MPKLKTRKAASKRYKITGGDNFLRRHAFKGHLLRKKSNRQKRKLSTQILAISVDSPFSHLHYLLSNRNQGGLGQLNFPLISDLNQTITNKYSLLTKDGFALPGVFIIDKEGIIQYYTVNNLLCGRSVNELLRILQSIQYIKENPGQVCPVDWESGDKILYSHPLKSKIYFKTLYSHKKT